MLVVYSGWLAVDAGCPRACVDCTQVRAECTRAGLGGPPLPLVAVGYVVVSVGALLSVHIDNGLTGQGGYELVLVLALAA